MPALQQKLTHKVSTPTLRTDLGLTGNGTGGTASDVQVTNGSTHEVVTQYGTIIKPATTVTVTAFEAASIPSATRSTLLITFA